MLRSASILWTSPLLALTACNGCGSGGVSLDQMPSQVAQTLCTKAYQCCTPAQIPDSGAYFPDEPTCEANFKSSLQGKRAVLQSEQGKGRVVYHGDRLAECLQRYAEIDCSLLKDNATSDIESCDDFLEPKVDAGAGCAADDDCIDGKCIGASNGADGTCVALQRVGASCQQAPCGAGLFCQSQSNTCQPLEPDGTSCHLNLECATGGCNGADGGTPGTCGLKGGAGNTCFVTSGCSVGGAGVLAPFGLLAILLRLRRRR